MRLRLGRRGLISLALVAGLILVLVFVVVPMVGRGILRDKLQALISEQMNATLEMGGLAYLPPYGARVTDATLTANDAQGRPVRLFSAKSLTLKLAELPLGSGPLVIKAVEIDTPSLHLVEEAGGMVGRGSPITEIATTQPTEQSKEKLSELFELRKLTMNDGSFVYENRTVEGSKPLVWRGLTLDVNTEQKSAAEYAFAFDGTNGKVGTFNAKGTFNIDELQLHLDQVRVEARVDASAPDNALPGQVQELLALYEVSGMVSVDSSGEIPLKSPMDGNLTSVVELKNARGKIPGAAAPLESVSLKITLIAEPTEAVAKDDEIVIPMVRAQLDSLEARGAGASLSASAKMKGDGTYLHVENLRLNTKFDSQSETSVLPRELLEELKAYALGGEATIELAGEGPVEDLTQGKVRSIVELKNATGKLPNAAGALQSVNLKINCEAQRAARPVIVAGYAVPLLKADIEQLEIVGPGATVSAGMKFDTAESMLRVENCRLDATIDPTVEQPALPAEVIEALFEYAASGRASIELSGEAPLADLQQAKGKAAITLTDATGKAPDAAAPFDDVNVKLQCDFEPLAEPTMVAGYAVPRVDATIEQLSVHGPGAGVSGAVKLATDAQRVTIQSCQLDASVDSSVEASALPPNVLELLKKYAAAGDASIQLTGDAPLADLARANIVSTIALKDARAQFPHAGAPIEDVNFQATVTTVAASVPAEAATAPLAAATQPAAEPQPLPKLLKVSINHLQAHGAGTSLDITGDMVVNGETRACGISALTITAQIGPDRSIFPKDLAATLDQYKATGKLIVSLSGSGPLPETKEALQLAQADLVIKNESLRLHLPDFPEPMHSINDITGELSGGLLTLKTVRAMYGEDIFFMKQAEVPIASLPDRLMISRVDGALTFANTVPNYPKDLADIMAIARPRGVYFYEGTADLDLAAEEGKAKHQYNLQVRSDGSAISALGGKVPMLNVVTDIRATPEQVTLVRFDANVMSGSATIVGTLTPGDESYQGEIRLRQIDLNTAAGLLAEPGETPLAVSGELSADMKVAGSGFDESALKNLRTIDRAVLQIARGDLYKIPVLRQIAERIQMRNAATVGDTEANISVANGIITLHEAVVAAPALGVSGKGTISFDQKLDIAGVANPLGSWTKHADIGLIRWTEEAITKGSSILYNVEISGTIEAPDVRVTGGEKLIDNE